MRSKVWRFMSAFTKTFTNDELELVEDILNEALAVYGALIEVIIEEGPRESIDQFMSEFQDASERRIVISKFLEWIGEVRNGRGTEGSDAGTV
jgi:hypothetical protein